MTDDSTLSSGITGRSGVKDTDDDLTRVKACRDTWTLERTHRAFHPSQVLVAAGFLLRFHIGVHIGALQNSKWS